MASRLLRGIGDLWRTLGNNQAPDASFQDRLKSLNDNPLFIAGTSAAGARNGGEFAQNFAGGLAGLQERERKKAADEAIEGLFGNDETLAAVAKAYPQAAVSEMLRRGQTQGERTYDSQVRREEFDRQVQLSRLQNELDMNTRRSQLTNKPFEAYIDGTLRQVMPNGEGAYVDWVTGAPVDPQAISFTEPAEEGGGLDQFGADSRARIAISGGNVAEAANALTQLYSPESAAFGEGEGAPRGAGYDPNEDKFSQALDAIPFPGSDWLGRRVGSDEYQLGEQSWKQFEASVLPIVSGSAVTDPEAARAIAALRPRAGDRGEIVQRKLRAINRMASVLNNAMAGDPLLLETAKELASEFEGGEGEGGGAGGGVTSFTMEDLQ